MKTDSEVRSIQQFLERVWNTPLPDDTETILFRGQLDNFSLLPKLFRNNEVDAVRRTESKMLKLLKQSSPHLTPSRPDNDWDWLSLGQHYGMATRMSDWSANPLVALFFAVEINPEKDTTPLVYQYPIKPVIVQKDKRSSSPLEIVHTRVIQPIHSHRSEAQAAWQVVHAIHRSVEGQYRFIPLATMSPHDERITEIVIRNSSVPAIREELKKMGMTHSTMYGDFGSVCRSIAPSLGLQ